MVVNVNAIQNSEELSEELLKMALNYFMARVNAVDSYNEFSDEEKELVNENLFNQIFESDLDEYPIITDEEEI